MSRANDFTGQKFGDWTVLHRSPNRSGQIMWHCKCVCGKERDVAAPSLRDGKSKSCGHFRVKGNPKHGKRWTKLYMVWSSMRSRCNTPTNKSYIYYGGRGIKVCPEWDDYAVFEEWAISAGYKEGLSIDRIDNDGNYEPSNCRWATPHEQRINQRPRRRQKKND